MQQCTFVFYRGAKKGQQCSKRTKGPYCYKHSKTVAGRGVDRAADVANDPVFQGPAAQRATAAPAEKLKSSVFTLTINRNKQLDAMSEDDKLTFKRFVDYICDEQGGLYDFIEDSNADDPRENIREITCEHFFESGSKLGLVHAHIYLSIVHVGHMRILLDKLRGLAKKTFNENIWIGIQVTSDPNTAFRNYIRADQHRVNL